MGERNRRSKEIEVGNRDPKEITNIITKKVRKYLISLDLDIDRQS